MFQRGKRWAYRILATGAAAIAIAADKIIHVVALCCVAMAIAILMATAAVHRIGFLGQDSANFLRIGSAMVITAPAILALGLASDMQVAIGKATGSYEVGSAVASASLLRTKFPFFPL